MTRQEKYAYWIMLADYDLATIPSLIEGQRWIYVAYLCQQAVERQLKGMFVYYNDQEAPKSHNVNYLFAKVKDSDRFKVSTDVQLFQKGKGQCEDFLTEVMYYYMSDYPFSYKSVKSRFVDKDTALGLCVKTQDQISWLRSFQPKVQLPDAI